MGKVQLISCLCTNIIYLYRLSSTILASLNCNSFPHSFGFTSSCHQHCVCPHPVADHLHKWHGMVWVAPGSSQGSQGRWMPIKRDPVGWKPCTYMYLRWPYSRLLNRIFLNFMKHLWDSKLCFLWDSKIHIFCMKSDCTWLHSYFDSMI